MDLKLVFLHRPTRRYMFTPIMSAHQVKYPFLERRRSSLFPYFVIFESLQHQLQTATILNGASVAKTISLLDYKKEKSNNNKRFNRYRPHLCSSYRDKVANLNYINDKFLFHS